jgi:ATP-dependent DNA ligase
MVSKVASSRYRSARSKTWLKTKCFTESELTLLGIDRDRKTGAARALAEGRVHFHDEDRLASVPRLGKA